MSAVSNTIYLKDYQPVPFIVESVIMKVTLSDPDTIVETELSIRRRDNAVSAPLVLDGENLNLQTIQMDGVALSADQYEQTERGLTIHTVPYQFVLKTVVHIQPQENHSLMGLFRSRDNYCSQCEAEGFRKITYFFDRPDIMTHFTTTIIADKKCYPYLLSNGNLIESGDLEHGQHWVKWHDPSLKPCYLFALVAGDFDLIEDTFTTCSGRTVELKFYLEKGFADQGAFALASLQRAMQWDEEQYGREYDLDIYMVVAVSDFNMGAMENKGLNVFNTKYVLAKDATATDTDYVGIEDVIGHEYFHNWTGNRITCRDWFQLTLKEGLTVFRDQTFSEDMTSRAVARINEVNFLRNGQFPEDAGPLAHPIRPHSYMEINNFYTATVYRKGAEVIRMIHTLIGKDAFRRGMDIYFERHDGQAVTTEDFVAAMEAGSERDLTQFKQWYDQVGTPKLIVSADYQSQDQTYTLSVQQENIQYIDRDDVPALHLPLVVGLIDQNGHAVPLKLHNSDQPAVDELCLELSKQEQSFTFESVETEPVVSLNRGFSAPVHIEFDYSIEALAWLVRYDQEPVARWDAQQQLSSQLILAAANEIALGQKPIFNVVIKDAWLVLFADDQIDLNLLSQLCSLPSVGYLQQQNRAIDIEHLFLARNFYQQQLAQQLQDQWLAQYQQWHVTTPYVYAVEAVAARAWKNTCLFYLVCTEQESFLQMAFDQLQQADNMTDGFGALSALSQKPSEFSQKALDLFFNQWQDEPLVVNKWLSVQAMTPRPETLERVKALTSDPAYDAQNPNNVYALICALGANAVALHLADHGAAYAFIADQVLKIDQYNPQVAARVLTPLTRWRQMDDRRGQLMLQQLERIAQSDQLSSDVQECVQKSMVENAKV